MSEFLNLHGDHELESDSGAPGAAGETGTRAWRSGAWLYERLFTPGLPGRPTLMETLRGA